MSGGSLNYLASKEPEDLFNSIEDLEEVEQILLQLNYQDIARDVRRLIEYLRTAYNRIDVLSIQLTDVFHSVEWWKSADYGDDTLRKHLDAYRAGEEVDT